MPNLLKWIKPDDATLLSINIIVLFSRNNCQDQRFDPILTLFIYLDIQYRIFYTATLHSNIQSINMEGLEQ